MMPAIRALFAQAWAIPRGSNARTQMIGDLYAARRMRGTGEDDLGAAAFSDAERRRAEGLAQGLRASGRDARVVTLWARPGWRAVQALCAAAAVAASTIAVDHEIAGLAVAACALLLAAADLSRRPLLRRLTPARATQNVIAPAPPTPGDRPVTLILTTATDDLRAGFTARLPFRLTAATLAALLILTLLLTARAVGASGLWLDISQLLPTLGLLAIIALLLERRPPVSPVSDATATVMTVAARLDTRPPANLDVAIVFAGGGDAHAAGLRRWLSDRRRRGLDPSSVAIVQIEPPQDDVQTWWEHDGLLFGAATHKQLTDAARSAATSTSGRAGEHRAVTTAAGIVRADGWPAIAISADADFVCAFVAELDAALG